MQEERLRLQIALAGDSGFLQHRLDLISIPRENIAHERLQIYFTYLAVKDRNSLAGCLAGATPCANELPHALSWTGAETLHVSKGRVIRLHMPSLDAT